MQGGNFLINSFSAACFLYSIYSPSTSTYAAWSTYGTGLRDSANNVSANSIVRSICVGLDGRIYAGGIFSNSGTLNNFAYWSTATSTWVNPGTGVTISTGTPIINSICGVPGDICLGGYFNRTNNGGYVLYNLAIYQITNNVIAQRVICLTENIKVLTPDVYLKIKDLSVGNFVLTDENKKIKIINIKKNMFKAIDDKIPCIIEKNSISDNYPVEDIEVSQYHMIKYNDKWLVPKLLKHIRNISNEYVTYYHIQLENFITDNLVINGGTVVESLGSGSNEDAEEWCNRYDNAIKTNNYELI